MTPELHPRFLYTDGGLIGPKNPSPHGGTWAWCTVGLRGEADEIVNSASGIVTPDQVGMAGVENNLSELWAAVMGLEALPAGWAGVWYTDSGNTLGRVLHGWKVKAVPWDLVVRMRVARARLGKFRGALLGGHPTKSELISGVRKDGKPCSQFNVWCDEACAAQAADYLSVRGVVR